jgi:hypothetical protein
MQASAHKEKPLVDGIGRWLAFASLLGAVLFLAGFAWAAIFYYHEQGVGRQLSYEDRPPAAAGFLVTIGFLIPLPSVIVKLDKFVTAWKQAKK